MGTPAVESEQPYLSERQRGVRAVVLGAVFGAVLALIGRRR
jgi:hypothetical protein